MKRLTPFFISIILICLISQTSFAQEEHSKSSWYIGFGLGSGAGNIEGETFSYWFDEFGDAFNSSAEVHTPITLNFGLGFILNPNIHLGLDISAIRQSATYSLYGTSGDISMQLTNYMVAATYYPFETGFSLKGGLGYSAFIMETSGDLFIEDSNSYGGKGILLGTGYQFWIGETFNLGIHLEYSRQIYNDSNAPEDSDYISFYISFYWL